LLWPTNIEPTVKQDSSLNNILIYLFADNNNNSAKESQSSWTLDVSSLLEPSSFITKWAYTCGLCGPCTKSFQVCEKSQLFYTSKGRATYYYSLSLSIVAAMTLVRLVNSVFMVKSKRSYSFLGVVLVALVAWAIAAEEEPQQGRRQQEEETAATEQVCTVNVELLYDGCIP
jgi:hypothetical protein